MLCDNINSLMLIVKTGIPYWKFIHHFWSTECVLAEWNSAFLQKIY